MSHFFERAALASCLAAAGCTPAADQPEPALARFITHVQRGRADAAWAALSIESRRALTAQHEALAAASGREPTHDPDQILFDEAQLRALAEPESIVVAGPLGDRVRLRVSVPDGPSAEITMVREDGEWRVDLTKSLRSPPDAPRRQPAKTSPVPALDPEATGRPATSTPSASSP